MDAEIVILFIVVFLGVGLAIYYLAYQRYLRRALRDPAAARHQNLPAPDNTVAVAAVILGFVALINISSAVNSISDKISMSIDNGASSIINNNGAEEIEAAINDQQSILAYFSDWEYERGEIEISLIPKQVNDSTSVTVYLGDESITLTRGKGAEFTGTFNVNSDDYYGAIYIVSVETDGVIYSESVESRMW
mgnify:CR=1 FL=1